MDNVLQKIEQFKIVPVVTIAERKDAEGMLGALCRGGLPVAEICFRTDCAEEAIRLAAEKFPQMLVGAGTVINGEQCRRALAAGAKFIVSPGLSAEVAKVCQEENVPYLPGVVTATEIMQALSAAFPQVRFMPTGGVSLENVNEYLSFSKIFACGGSWMVKGNAEEIEKSTRAAVAAVKGGSHDTI